MQMSIAILAQYIHRNTTQDNEHNINTITKGNVNTTPTQYNITQHMTTQCNTTQNNTTQHNATPKKNTIPDNIIPIPIRIQISMEIPTPTPILIQHNTTRHNKMQHNTIEYNMTRCSTMQHKTNTIPYEIETKPTPIQIRTSTQIPTQIPIPRIKENNAT